MTYNIRDFGAVADGKTLNTRAIQDAVNTCSANGGGRVLVENGVYSFGTIVLKSNVELHIAANATLLGSPDMNDYPERNDVKHVISQNLPRWQNACYIYCEESENVSITGMGKIDCNGKAFVVPQEKFNGWKYTRIPGPTPPRVIFFAGCKNVKFEDFTVINQPAGWCFWITDCSFVTCRSLIINSETEYPNNDGIHINCSNNVSVSDCKINCGDDCIVVRANSRALHEDRVCEKIAVTNCNLTSYSGGIRVGWCCDGIIRNCTFSNLVMTNTTVGIDIRLPALVFDPKLSYTSDIGRESTLIENLTFNNIIMDKIFAEPVKIMIDPDTEHCKVNAVRNLYFSNIHASSPQGIQVEGRKENVIENIRFSDCTFSWIDYSEFDDDFYHGAANASYSHGPHPLLNHCRRVSFDNVEFSANDAF